MLGWEVTADLIYLDKLTPQFLTRACHAEDHWVIAGRVVDSHIDLIIIDVLVGHPRGNHLDGWL